MALQLAAFTFNAAKDSMNLIPHQAKLPALDIWITQVKQLLPRNNATDVLQEFFEEFIVFGVLKHGHTVHNAELSGGLGANAESPSGVGRTRAGANSSDWLRR
ncbi:hypothetical protein [Thioalkalivibrio sp. ALE14]|nr:hypothetical protein [Thioalkalivibrio sp. ALE14]